jgi:amidohydrolase
MNDATAIDVLHNAVHQTLGSGAIAPTDQSLGGEDFAWYLEDTPGAMARLGVRLPSVDTAADLHTPGFDPSEEAISLGTTILTSAALLD